MHSAEAIARFPSLGSDAVVAVTAAEELPAARAAVERILAEIDLACSRFRDDSELTAVNAAAGAPVRVSPLLLDAVASAVRAAELTDGDVDPTVGGALVALGYDRDFELIGAGARDQPRVRVTSVPGWRTVEVSRAAGTVRVASGVTLDLGATAKALAADRAVASAQEACGCGVLVSLGGDIALAGEPPSDGWRVRVTDDHRSSERAPGQTVSVRTGGLATSSTTTRRWQTEAGPAHHLLDPATGRPAQGMWRTVSVAAATCLDANIATTAAIVRGEPAVEWLESLGLASRLVAQDGSVRHLAGWPSEGEQA